MAANFIQPPANTGLGLKVDTSELVVGANTVERQNIVIADPVTAANLASVSAAGALKVDSSGATQPVSGTVAVSNFPATQPISGSVTATQGTGSNLHVVVDTAPTTAVTLPVGQAVELLDSAGTNKASISAAGAIKVDGSAVTQPVSLASTTVTGTVAVTESGTWTVQPGNTANTTAWKVDGSAVTQPVSGTFFQATQPVSGTVTAAQATAANLNATVVGPTLTKGTQGAAGFSTQDLKDSGRTFLTFTATAAAGVTSETLFSFSQNKGGTVTGAVSSYVITSGKIFRITAIAISVRAGAAAVPFSRCTLRSNTAGATTASSAVVFQCPEVFGISATSGVGGQISIGIPDGLEILGNGTLTIGMSHLDQATTNVINITICGYEY